MEEDSRIVGPYELHTDGVLWNLYEIVDAEDPDEVLNEIWVDPESKKIEMVYKRRGASWYITSKNMLPDHVINYIEDSA